MLSAAFSFIFLSFLPLSYESKYTIIIFNFLFVALTFPLNGELKTKSAMLMIGNIVCLFGNLLFSLFFAALIYYFGESLKTVYVFLNPFLNLLWIVSLWSVTLAALASSDESRRRRLAS